MEDGSFGLQDNALNFLCAGFNLHYNEQAQALEGLLGKGIM